MSRTLKIRPFLHWCVLALLFALANTANAEIAIIANPALHTDKLSAETVEKIFLSVSPVLPDGTRVMPIAQPATAAISKAFNDKILKKEQKQLLAYWSRIIFTGTGKPPATVDDDNSMKSLIAHTPTAIGYINASSVDTSVKVILLVP